LSALSRLRPRRNDNAPEPGMVKAEDLAKTRRAASAETVEPSGQAPDSALVARRERLAERLTLMQLELGGAFYEMATRDHVQMDALMARAAELQAVDAELAHVDDLLASGRRGVGGMCATCQAPHARGAAFCWQCGASLEPAGADAPQA
jgi:hypothetical protein